MMADTHIPAWQRSKKEAAIDPDTPLIDSHHHLWDIREMTRLHGRFLPEDLAREIDASGHNVEATVYIECYWAYRTTGPEHLRCVGETEWVEQVAQQQAQAGITRGKISAIVGHGDLAMGAGAVQEMLEAHQAASPERFRGVRDALAAEPEVPWAAPEDYGKINRPAFREGFARLAPLGLSFELICAHPQLGDALDLAHSFPGTTIILNHLGMPLGTGRFDGKRDEVLVQWKTSMKEVATCPNVFLKLGGLGMGCCGCGWVEAPTPPDSEEIAAAYRPYVLHAVDAFSPQRCMFESNFPVDGDSYGYGPVWNAFKRVAAAYSPDERHALFAGTARRVYRLPGAETSRAV